MSDVDAIIREQAKLAGERANWDSWCQQIGLRVLPESAQFTIINEEGTRRQDRLFTTRPVIANQQFAAVMEDLLTPRSQIWHALVFEDDDLDDEESKIYLERLNKLLFSLRYRSNANYASQKQQGYLHLGAYGSSCMFIDEEGYINTQRL